MKIIEKVDKLTAGVSGDDQVLLKSLLSTLTNTLSQLKAIGADETRIPKALLDYQKQKDLFDEHYEMLSKMFADQGKDINEEYSFVRKTKTEI